MHVKARLAFLIPLAAILGCGSTPTPSAPDSSYLNLTGDWVALAAPNPANPGTLPTPVSDFFGALQSSGGTVTGTLRAISLSLPQCVTQDLQATGTIDTNNSLKLTIPISGGTATITATITTPESYTPGTWQIVGGTCAMPSTSIDVAEFAPATGTYTGVLNVLDLTTDLPVAGTATNVTAVLTQSTTPNADGEYPLSGTVTATGACSGSFPIANEAVSGGVLMPTPATGPLGVLNGGIIPTATTLIADFSPSPACGSQIYSGTLTPASVLFSIAESFPLLLFAGAAYHQAHAFQASFSPPASGRHPYRLRRSFTPTHRHLLHARQW